MRKTWHLFLGLSWLLMACGSMPSAGSLDLGFARRAQGGPCPEQPLEPAQPPAVDRLEVTLYNGQGEVHYSGGGSPREGMLRLGGIEAGEDLELLVVGWQAGAPAWKGGASGVDIIQGKNVTASVFLSSIQEASCALRPLSVPRALLAAASLPDGRVLLIGGVERVEANGCGAGCDLWHSSSRVDVFDPRNGLVYPLERMNRPRALATATLLADGSVLVVGGTERVSLGEIGKLPLRVDPEHLVPSLEIYYPSRGLWVEKAMPEGMVFHSATRLLDGRVLLAGGGTGLSRANASDRAYFFDPAASPPDDLKLISSRMVSERLGHAAVLTPAGHVMVLGGALVPTLGLVEEFNPEQSGGVFFSREVTGQMVNYFFAAAALIPLRPDEILLTGGRNFDSTSLVPPSSDNVRIVSHISFGEIVFSLGPSMSEPRFLFSMVETGDRRLLLAGGFKDSLMTPGTAVDVFDPQGKMQTVGYLSVGRGAHALAPLVGQRALAAGGFGPAGWLGSVEIVTPPTP